MSKLGASIATAAAVGYTLVIFFMVALTVAFFGLDDLSKEPVGLAVFSVMALSPLVVWPCCLKRAAAWRRGERPPL